MSIEVERKASDGLSRTVYKFSLTSTWGDQIEVRLTAISQQTRETTRKRGWTTVSSWNLHRHESNRRATDITDPQVPEDVIAEARDLVISRIGFVLP